MDITGPIVRPAAGAVGPEHRRLDPTLAADLLVVPSDASAVAPPPVDVDHIRAHGVTCFWDHVECRWRCIPSPD